MEGIHFIDFRTNYFIDNNRNVKIQDNKNARRRCIWNSIQSPEHKNRLNRCNKKNEAKIQQLE